MEALSLAGSKGPGPRQMAFVMDGRLQAGKASRRVTCRAPQLSDSIQSCETLSWYFWIASRDSPGFGFGPSPGSSPWVGRRADLRPRFRQIWLHPSPVRVISKPLHRSRPVTVIGRSFKGVDDKNGGC